MGSSTTGVDEAGKLRDKTSLEELISKFKFERLLNQDQAGRRITLLGNISDQPALLTLERAAFPSDPQQISALHAAISSVQNLGANDIYSWYLASSGGDRKADVDAANAPTPDLKINLIYPCTAQHIKKYSVQKVRMVTETPEIYKDHVHPFMAAQRASGRLNWVFNIIEGRTEQEDVILRDHSSSADGSPETKEEAFLLLPDLNWDRKTLGSLHLLALVERRDIWSLRDLKKTHIKWLKTMREKVLDATVRLYPELERDMLKLYLHYQPTYYHFHIHVVNCMLEAGTTQSVGKAFGLENVISQLEMMSGDDTVGMDSVSLTYYLGEESGLWKEVFLPLKEGNKPKSI